MVVFLCSCGFEAGSQPGLNRHLQFAALKASSVIHEQVGTASSSSGSGPSGASGGYAVGSSRNESAGYRSSAAERAMMVPAVPSAGGNGKARPASAGDRLVVVPDDGDCGFHTASVLLQRVPLYASNAPTAGDVRRQLGEAWKAELRLSELAASGDTKDEDLEELVDDVMTFVSVRADQVPQAVCRETLAEQAEAVLAAMKKDASSGLPYWLVFSDWQMLSDHYQVDFVVNCVPGSSKPLSTGSGFKLNVQWTSSSQKHDWGHWQPIAVESDTSHSHSSAKKPAAGPSSSSAPRRNSLLTRRRRSVEEDVELQLALAESLKVNAKARRSSTKMEVDELVGLLLDLGVDYEEALTVAHVSGGDMKDAMKLLEPGKPLPSSSGAASSSSRAPAPVSLSGASGLPKTAAGSRRYSEMVEID
eukprot:TRINITY_DN14489_c0_g2_i1.p1 TRINITY_DN14489_c0_g2~~TRINITY_DN14489_c0_g2_i1.p1  ORF type:complete len:418 (+),score=100.91 TRINITY_DN14489_c0_g2_i1:40-1293(+)